MYKQGAIMAAFASRSAMLAVSLVTVLTLAGVMAVGRAADANGLPGQAAVELPTRFQRFVLGACSSCVRESHPITTLALPPFTPAFPRVAFRQTMRPGPVEMSVEVLRAYPLGQPSRQFLALRMSAWVASGPSGPQYLLGEGVLDEEEVGALVATMGEISRMVSASPSGGDETVDVDFRGGSLRVGVIRLRGDTLAYVQGGDISAFALRAVWDVPTTVYLPVTELSSLAKAFGQAAAKIQTLRSAR